MLNVKSAVFASTASSDTETFSTLSRCFDYNRTRNLNGLPLDRREYLIGVLRGAVFKDELLVAQRQSREVRSRSNCRVSKCQKPWEQA